MNRRLLSSKQRSSIFRCFSAVVKQTPAEYCLELIRKNDYENFLCTLLLPSDTRAAGIAIRAFNVEIALVEDQVHDRQIGTMRLKFWKDAVDKTFEGNPPKSPVMLELHRVFSKHSLSKHYFKRLIDVRLERLNGTQFLNTEALEKYAEYSASSVYYLLLEANNIVDINTDHVASHMGKAHGIVTLIRSIPYNAKKRVNILPQDVLMKHNISTEAVLQGHVNASLQDAICDVASCGKLHLDSTKSLKKQVKKNVEPIFLPIICIENYLEELRRVDFNVFHPKLQRRNNLLPLQLMWRKFWMH